MRAALLVLLPLAACASPEDESREAGDRAFRMERYHDAYASYSEIENPSEEVVQLAEESRFRSIMLSAQERIHVNEIDDALRLLSVLEQERPGEAEITELRRLAYQRKASELAASGERLLDDGYPEAALRTYREALRWAPEHEEAQRGYRESERLAGARAERGESLYFEGLEQVMNGRRTQAHTSFAHAAQLLGKDSRAVEQLDALSKELATELAIEAHTMLDDGLLGGAWMVLSDATRLDPGNLDAAALYARVDQELEARRLLSEADLHVRGGRLDAAEAVLARVLEVTGEAHGEKVQTMTDRAVAERALRDYKLARACELDNQIVRAVALYENILRVTGGGGFEDLRLRVDNLKRRIDLAAEAYRVALEAQTRGDAAGYQAALEDCLELAGDYADAYERHRLLMRD